MFKSLDRFLKNELSLNAEEIEKVQKKIKSSKNEIFTKNCHFIHKNYIREAFTSKLLNASHMLSIIPAGILEDATGVKAGAIRVLQDQRENSCDLKKSKRDLLRKLLEKNMNDIVDVFEERVGLTWTFCEVEREKKIGNYYCFKIWG